MQDVNRKKRFSLWVVLAISLLSIPLFIYFDNRQISEGELITIANLTLSQDPVFKSGKRSSIKISLTNTARTLVINLEELNCVNKDEILGNFKEGDTIDIKILRTDTDEFYKTSFISKYQKIYGLYKKPKEYILLSCRNSVSTQKTNAATYASFSTALLSLFLAIFIFKPKTKQQATNQLKIDPILLICLCWFLVAIIFR